MKSIFVVWKDSEDHMWHPVAKLSRSNENYQFNYTKGASNKSFIPFPRMDDLNKVYNSSTLFSFFSNRLMPSNRPEFKKMLQWSDIKVDNYDEFDLLGVSGGARKTDEFQIISEPEITENGDYKIRFFISGVRYLDSQSNNKVNQLKNGESLYFVYEDSNPHDCKAILVSTIDDIPIGYCPKYLNCDVRVLLENPSLSSTTLRVVKTNLDAPSQFRILCEFTTKWPEGFIPMVSEEYLAYTNNS
ncbi:HIRAN domain-containing protein [Shewanella sp. HL-SH8]|uniref:HIRAN domain-containing protein n=1 Tax=Shewanella sp. HL-SH8 TaxID=3436242 RepID=UPI003EB816C5